MKREGERAYRRMLRNASILGIGREVRNILKTEEAPERSSRKTRQFVSQNPEKSLFKKEA